MSILKVKNKNGEWVEIIAIKGADGKDAVTDQKYDPKSQNAQSGIAVEEAIANSIGNIETILATVVTADETEG